MNEQIQRVMKEILARKDGKRPFLVAIDGGSAGGKSTMGAALAGALRTPERLRQPGGNVHWERVLEQVLEPLKAGRPPEYGVFDCSAMAVTAFRREPVRDVVIVEGAYSLHPALRDAYDLKVFLSVDAPTQRARILARNGEKMLQRFLKQWIPLENAYFEACAVRDCCDIIL